MFMEFDEEKFYPSISRELLQKAINWTWTFVRISNGEINVIMHSWKSLLFDGDNIWIKKHDDPNFKITMASYDATEICELVGLYILHVLREKHGKEKNGFYWRFGIFFEISSDRKQNEYERSSFQYLKLNLNLASYVKRIWRFVDVTWNLNTGTHKSYNKPNNNPLYININSNHPPNINNTFPENIQKRINKLFSNTRIFNNSKDLYNNAMSASGIQQKIKYEQGNTSATPKINKKSYTLWFNRPYSANVITKIGNKFFQILDKYFPKSRKFHQLFNQNNVRVSYGSLLNFASIINSHNKKILRQEEMASPKQHCNCRAK